MMNKDAWNRQPLYERIRHDLLKRLNAGEWPVSGRIPTENELMKEYDVSRITIRQAIAQLVQEGRLSKIQGKGTFVCHPGEWEAIAGLTGFAEEFRLRGCQVQVHLLERGYQEMPPELGVFFSPPISKSVYIRRWVEVDQRPCFVARHWLPLDVDAELSEEDWHYESIYLTLGERGFVIEKGWQELGAVRLDAEDASVLGCPAGNPALRVRRVTYDSLGRAIEAAEAVYHPERYAYRLYLKR